MNLVRLLCRAKMSVNSTIIVREIFEDRAGEMLGTSRQIGDFFEIHLSMCRITLKIS